MQKDCDCGSDIDLASHVQQLLFPKISPVCSWCCIGTQNRMAQGLGGDFFDFIAMPDGRQGIFVGDVTGHGVHASLVMSLLYGFIHRSSRERCSPLDLVRQANGFLQFFAARSREFDHFFSSTLFCGIIDPGTLQMDYVNSGHPAPLVRRDGKVLSLSPTGPPIGFFNEPEVGMGTFAFARDDRFLLFTDGIVESVNPEGTPFGRQQIEDRLLRHHGDHLSFLDELFSALREFGGGDSPRDDCTAIVLDFKRLASGSPRFPVPSP